MKKLLLAITLCAVAFGSSPFRVFAGVPGKIDNNDEERRVEREIKSLVEQLGSSSEADRKDAIEKLIPYKDKAVAFLADELKKADDDFKKETLQNALSGVKDGIAYDAILEDLRKNLEPLKGKKEIPNDISKTVSNFISTMNSLAGKHETNFKTLQKAIDYFKEKEMSEYPDMLSKYFMKMGYNVQYGVQLEDSLEKLKNTIKNMGKDQAQEMEQLKRQLANTEAQLENLKTGKTGGKTIRQIQIEVK